MEVNLNPAMNEQIVDLLRISEEPLQLYAAAYIESLTARVAELEAERDAAVADIPHNCSTCRYLDHRHLTDGQMDALCRTCINNRRSNWLWRGGVSK